MKRGTRWGEGWLILAALTLLAALLWMIWMDRQPRAQLAAPVHSVALEAVERAGQIDINSASAAELEELPGVGPVLAAAIAEYRGEHGPFESPEELLGVRGIGPVTLEGMRPYLRLD